MKAVHLVLVFLISAVMAETLEEVAAKIQNHHKECLAKSHLDLPTLAKIRAGDIDESNPAILEHIFCYCVKVGFSNEAGDLNENVIRGKLGVQEKNVDVVDKTVKLCNATEKNSNIKLYYARVISCYQKNVPAGVKVM